MGRSTGNKNLNAGSWVMRHEHAGLLIHNKPPNLHIQETYSCSRKGTENPNPNRRYSNELPHSRQTKVYPTPSIGLNYNPPEGVTAQAEPKFFTPDGAPFPSQQCNHRHRVSSSCLFLLLALPGLLDVTSNHTGSCISIPIPRKSRKATGLLLHTRSRIWCSSSHIPSLQTFLWFIFVAILASSHSTSPHAFRFSLISPIN